MAEKAKVDKGKVEMDEHVIPLSEVLKRYTTSINVDKPEDSDGLTGETARKLKEVNGPNLLTPPKTVHPIMVFIHCLTSLFNLLLIVAGILTYIMYAIKQEGNEDNLYLGVILLLVAVLNSLIEFIQIQKSAALLKSFLNMMPQQTRCIREKKLIQLSAQDLVLGDIVYVRIGDKIPADVLMFQCSDIKVDNSSLTGESDPQTRTVENDHKNPLEATNLAFNGTLAVAGEGYGIVIRTGDNTVLGQIAGMTAGEKKNKSPLTVEIDTFVKLIATVAALTAIIFFSISMATKGNLNNALNFAIGVFVAWVPEGLPATVTMLLSVAAKRMATQKVLVKDLKGVETLGAITLLATDKTGTLTRNQMTVTNIWSNLQLYSALTSNSQGVKEIMLNSTLNSRAKFNRTDVALDKREIIGDATETGLFRFAAQHLEDFDMASNHSKVFEIPFNSDNKWAMTIAQYGHENGDLTLFLKGAPERVLKICSSILVEGQAQPLTEEHQTQYNEMYEYMASKGHRVLAFAQLKLEHPVDFKFDLKEKNYPYEKLTFVGLTSLEDPPKHGVREAIGRCRTAGIRVMMVTGDHPLTAEAIGRKINLMISDTKEMLAKREGKALEQIAEDNVDAIVIHGETIDSLEDKDWDNIFAKKEIIFARTSPKHKLQIVKRAQSMGHIVGVTGDGVNDSPALKKADLGIAMNESGSDVSKEAAAMILLDDNFASTVRGIEEGRLIFTNLKKSIQYTVTHSMPEVLPQLVYILANIPVPLTSILILVVDLGFELFASLSFAWDKPETKTGLMKLPPRKPVSFASVERFRRAQGRRLQEKVDPETGDTVKSTALQTIGHTLKSFFSWAYWKEKFESTDDEIVIDCDLLSWAYLEIGILQTVICFIAYFWVLNDHGISMKISNVMQLDGSYFEKSSPDFPIPEENRINGIQILNGEQQYEALAQAQSIYYLSLMILQGFNLFAVKARLKYPFGPHMFSNWKNFFGLACGFALGMLVVYVPPLNVVFGTSYKTDPIYWFISIIGGIVILAYTSIRFFIRSKSLPTKFNPEISGLQMHPTVRTMATRA